MYDGDRSYAHGEHERAIDYYSKALALLTSDRISIEGSRLVQMYYKRALSCFNTGRYDEAVDDFSKVIEYLPNWDEPYYNRGYCYLSTGLYEHAIADFTKSLEIKPCDPIAYNARGVGRMRRDQYELAIDDFAKALEIEPNHRSAQGNLEDLRDSAPDPSIRRAASEALASIPGRPKVG